MNESLYSLDPRVNAIRPDLADASLQALVNANAYAEPVLKQCVRGILPLLAAPHADAERVSEIRYGEFVDVFETREDGFSWVQNRTDRSVGYLPTKGAFSEQIAALSHRVTALHTFVYAEPYMKSRVIDTLTLGSFVQIAGRDQKFVELTSGGYIFVGHVTTSEEAIEKDYIFTAGRLMNVPYLWGGRTSLGIDCSGLVQLALDMAGLDCPRDSDLQMEAMGHDLPGHWRDILWQRGDIVFFDDHVGMITGGDHLIHATSETMRVVVEPLVDVVLRGRTILAIGRPL